MSQELAVQNYEADIQALIESQDEALEAGGTLQVPIIKLTQSMTAEVKAGDAEAGEFYNTLSNESYGSEVEFIVVMAQEGRALSGKGGAYGTAIGQDTIPQSWADRGLVGEEDVGVRFDEHPDAHEQYSVRVNNGEIEWESGPSIATTYNYTGLLVTKDEDGQEQLLPGRITFQRSTKDAHMKIANIKTSLLRGKAFWDVVFEFESEEKSSGRNDYYGIKVRKGRLTTQDERLRAVELATSIINGGVTDNSERGETAPAKPVAESGEGLGI